MAFSLLLLGVAQAQDAPKKKKKGAKGMGTQADLDAEMKKADEENLTPQQKAYFSAQKKILKQKKKRSEADRKRAKKGHDKNLNSAKAKVARKKRNYVKTHK